MPHLSDLEDSYDSSYQPGSDVSTGIESYNIEIESDDKYMPEGNADGSDLIDYQPSNASINRMVNELEEGLDNGDNRSGEEGPTHCEGLRANRTRDYSYRYGFLCLEEVGEQHNAMMHRFKLMREHAAALEKMKECEFHYTNFLRVNIDTQQEEDPELDAAMPKIAHRVMLQLATKQGMIKPPPGTQVPIKQGLRAFGERGTEAVGKELLQIHLKNTFTPRKFQDLSVEQ